MAMTTRMTKKQQREQDINETKNMLVRLLEKTKGTSSEMTAYTKVNHVSKSGMSRDIQIFLIVNNEPWNITPATALILGWPLNDRGVRVSGAGMDMGFHLVYNLSASLFGHQDQGGYLIKQRWL